jgi:hypothetical protein
MKNGTRKCGNTTVVATRFSRFLLYFIVIMLPISVMLLGATLTVLMTGGEMFECA